ncbi:MAG: hypothetical protein AAFX92_16295, partial [Pseudomonadota bacterium]
MALTDRLVPPERPDSGRGTRREPPSGSGLGGLANRATSWLREGARWVWDVYWGIWRFIFSRLGLKRYLPRTLFGRTLIIIVTPVLLVQGIAAYYFYDRHWDSVTLRLSTGVAGEIGLVIEE